MLKIVIPGTLPGLNEYVRANRANARKGSRMSRDAHMLCKLGMIKVRDCRIDKIKIVFRWIEPNRRRDKDNISFAKKFILDSLQEAGIIKNDGWDEIISFRDEFYLDRKNPRVEVYIFAPDEKEMV